MKKKAFTLTELVLAMVVITLVVMVTLPLTHKKMDKVEKYSYYMGYDLVKNMSVLLEESMISNQANKKIAFSDKLKKIINKNTVVKLIQASVGINPAYAGFCNCYTYDCPNESDNHQEQIDCGQESHWKYVWGSYRCSADCDCYCDEPEPEPTPDPKPEGCLGMCTIYDIDVGNNDRVIGEVTYDDITEQECYKYTNPDSAWPCGYNCVKEYDWVANDDCTPSNPQPDTPDKPEVNDPTLPTAADFCKRVKDNFNISAESCSSPVVKNNVTDFSALTPHIVFANGLKMYMSDPGEIPQLANSKSVKDSTGFILYIDVNGKSGKSELYKDIFPFYLVASGKVIPGYNSNSPAGANNNENLSLNVVYDNYATTKRTVKLLLKDTNFRSAACSTGFVTSSVYCKNSDNTIINQYDMCKDAYHDCRFIVNKPFRIF